jgi:hypothetical protein
MGIFDRLGRMARAEVSELKRVLREAREQDEDGTADADERERQRLITEAEAELARAEGDVLAAEIEAGAAAWGGEPASPGDPEIARGADLWARPGDRDAAVDVEHLRSAPPASARQARVGVFTREVREAYAALELPLGSDRAAIETAFRALTLRYHPDRHAQSPQLQRTATELTIRIREARDLLLAWLEGA